MAALRNVLRIVGASAGPLTALILVTVYLYSRLQALTASNAVSLATPVPETTGRRRWRTSLRSWLATSRLARLRFTFRMGDGSRIRCRIADCGALLSVHVDRDYDLPELDWARLTTMLDVGAHVGSFSIWAAKRSPSARILAVEPNPDSYRQLCENIERNHVGHRVRAVRMAVGPRPGTRALELIEHSLGTRLAAAGRAGVEVDVDTLPGLVALARFDHIDLLKIDCEGMEYDVFTSLDREQFATIRSLACEYHPVPGHSLSQLRSTLELHGYSVQAREVPVGVLWAQK